jgi:hypothetical protein
VDVEAEMRASISVAIAGLLCVNGIGSDTAQSVQEDTSANPVFLGCKALVEDRASNTQLVNIANFCSGVVHALGYVGRFLSILRSTDFGRPTVSQGRCEVH